MEKLTTKQIIDAIKRNIWLIILPALLFAGLIFVKELAMPGTYEAESVLIVTNNNDKPITYNNLILNEKLANIYGQFLESDDLFESVNEKIDSNRDSSMITKNFAYNVNPQAGVITLTYTDTNEDRAFDTLTMIGEEFRSYAKNYLQMENIEYLQNVSIKEASKTRGVIFTVIAGIAGALLGVLLMIIKEILSDKIHDANDIRELGIEVLADLTKDFDIESAKLKRKIETKSDRAVIGFTSITGSTDYRLFEELPNTMGIQIVDTNQVIDSINTIKSNSPYLGIVENSQKDPQTIDLASHEDYKILLLNDKKISKNELRNIVDEYKRLGIEVLGVVYY